MLHATGCNSYHSVTIGVSTNDGAAVQGASVHVAPMYFFNPTNERHAFIFGAYDILEPFPAEGDGGITDIDGVVILKIVDDSPQMLTIFTEGFKPWRGQIAMSKQDELIISSYTTDPDFKIVGTLPR